MDQGPASEPSLEESAQERAPAASRAVWDLLRPLLTPKHSLGNDAAPLFVGPGLLVLALLFFQILAPDRATHHYGMVVRDGLEILSVEARPASDTTQRIPLAGDRIAQVDKLVLKSWQDLYQYASDHREKPATLHIESSSGERFVFERPSEQDPPFPLVPGVLWLSAGVLLAWLWPKGGGVFALYTSCLSMGAVTLMLRLMPLGHSASLAVTAGFNIVNFWLPMSFVMTFMSLPYPIAPLRRYPALTLLPTLLAPAFFPVSPLGSSPVFPASLGLMLATMLLLPLARIRQARSRSAKKQFLWLALVPFLGVLPAFASAQADRFILALSHLSAGLAVLAVLGYLALSRNLLDADLTTLRLGMSSLHWPLGVCTMIGYGGFISPYQQNGVPFEELIIAFALGAVASYALTRVLGKVFAGKRDWSRYLRRDRVLKRTSREMAILISKLPLSLAAGRIETMLRTIFRDAEDISFLERDTSNPELFCALGESGREPQAQAQWVNHPHALFETIPRSGKGDLALSIHLSRSPGEGERKILGQILEALKNAVILSAMGGVQSTEVPGYRLYSRIAVGGMGDIFLGDPKSLLANPATSVIKMLRQDLDLRAESKAMFAQEFETLRRLRHENVVAVNGSGHTPKGDLFIAMEYVDGADLGAILHMLNQEGRHLPLELVYYVAESLLNAMAYAHSAFKSPIVHRDISPDNLLVALDGTIKLSNFGVAVVQSDGARGHAGKIDYMAPEIFSKKADFSSIGPALDIYAAGVLLCQLILGEHPYRQTTASATLEAMRTYTFPDLKSARPGLPDAFCAYLKKATHLDPSKRFEDGDAMLRSFLRLPRPSSRLDMGPAAFLGELCVRASDPESPFGTCYSSEARRSFIDKTMVDEPPAPEQAIRLIKVARAERDTSLPDLAFKTLGPKK